MVSDSTAPSAPPAASLGSRRHRFAQLVAEVFGPAVVVTLLTAAISLHATADVPSGLLWGAVGIVFCSGIPFAIMFGGARVLGAALGGGLYLSLR